MVSYPGTGALGWGAWCGLRPLALQGVPLHLGYVSWFSIAKYGMGPAHFMCLPLLLVSTWLLFYL